MNENQTNLDWLLKPKHSSILVEFYKYNGKIFTEARKIDYEKADPITNPDKRLQS